jgi:large subunit ribosomal protein L22
MGKKAKESRLSDNQAMVVKRNLRISPRKLNLVAQSIRGLTAEKALVALEFSRKRIARDVKAALESAVANAENNHQLNVDRLFVREAYVGKSFVMKRFHARGRGRMSKILKPFSHLTIIVEEQGETA